MLTSLVNLVEENKTTPQTLIDKKPIQELKY